jgi:hypothetical protein
VLGEFDYIDQFVGQFYSFGSDCPVPTTGFSFAQNFCQKCFPTYCIDCDPCLRSQCTLCEAGYAILVTGKCGECIDPYVVDSRNKCSKCKSPFHYVSDLCSDERFCISAYKDSIGKVICNFCDFTKNYMIDPNNKCVC